MPGYSHLAKRPLDLLDIKKHLSALQTLGVPYTDDMVKHAYADAIAQQLPESDSAERLAERYGEKVNIRDFAGNPRSHPTEMDAIIAYLQVLGTMVEFKDYNRDITPDTVEQAE